MPRAKFAVIVCGILRGANKVREEMRIGIVGVLCLVLANCAPAEDAPPSEAVLQQVLTAELKAITKDYQRTVLFEQVKHVSSNGGYHKFVVTVSVHDYNPGYPPNGYWGQTCLGKFTNEPLDLVRGPAGKWLVQGRLTPPESTCKDNPEKDVSSFPLAQIPGQQAPTGAVAGAEAAKPTGGQLYVGEYACYGTGGRMMTGMGFRLSSGRYADLDGERGGTYTYDEGAATVTFIGGYMDGQTGTDVTSQGFQISSTVNCEPWR